MSDKKGLLPRVTPETGSALLAELRSGKLSYIVENLERMCEDNPWIVEAVRGYCSEMPDAVNQVSLGVTVMVYRLLESQAEADKLNKEFNFDFF